MSLYCENLEGSQNQSWGEESIREDFLDEEENSQFEGKGERNRVPGRRSLYGGSETRTGSHK